MLCQEKSTEVNKSQYFFKKLEKHHTYALHLVNKYTLKRNVAKSWLLDIAKRWLK